MRNFKSCSGKDEDFCDKDKNYYKEIKADGVDVGIKCNNHMLIMTSIFKNKDNVHIISKDEYEALTLISE